jgi:glycerol kinase
MSILVVDVGTSGLRAAVVDGDARIVHEEHRELLPDTPFAGLVEFDAAEMARVALEVTRRVLAEAGPVDAVGITTQRASTVVWDRATGEPVAPAIGWQDLRTVGECLALREQGLRLAPNVSATKLANILDLHDPDRSRDLCFGTPDTWIAWVLSEGALHVTDLSNAGITGMTSGDGSGAWDPKVLDVLRVPEAMLPTIVDSTGEVGAATALDGAPPIAGIVGDQQSSLIGQGCVQPGLAKITFGTGGMLDLCLGDERPTFTTRGGAGTFPIAAWRDATGVTWGTEAIMLSAGTNVEWLRDDLQIIDTAADSHDVASQCEDTDGVVYVPALLGLGTPKWDYGARGTLLGITRGTGRPQVVRAVLEGVAQRAADLVEATEADSGLSLETLRADGGMTDNPTFVQAVADATQRPVEIAPVKDATTLGAAFLAGLAIGTWSSWDDVAATWAPRATIEPGEPLDRDRWKDAVERASGWHGDLSGIDF